MRIKENLLLKVLAFLLAVAAFTGAALMAWYQIINVDVIWGNGTPADGYTIDYLERKDRSDLYHLLSLYRAESQGEELNIYETQSKVRLESSFDAEHTNLRWQVRDSAGVIRYGNTRENVPVPTEGLYVDDFSWQEPYTYSAEILYGDWPSAAEEAVNVTDTDNVIYSDLWQSDLMEAAVSHAQESSPPAWPSVTSSPPAALSHAQESSPVTEETLDAVWLDADGCTDLLIVTDDRGEHVYGPTIRAYLEVNEYGFRYSWGWNQEEEPAAQTEPLSVTMWLEAGCPVRDEYRQAYYTLADWKACSELLLAGNIACVVVGLLLTVYLCVGAGHKRGVDGISLHWFHRIPGDLLLAVIALGVTLAVCVLVEELIYSYTYIPMYGQLLGIGTLAACTATLVLAWLVTFAARCKARTLWKNTLIWRLCRLIWRLCCWCLRTLSNALAALPMVWKALVVGLVYLLFSVLTFRGSPGLWLLGTAAVIAYLCLWAYQWKRIRQGTKEIIGGNPDHHIDTRRMLPDLRAHADELNNLGQSISIAVDERMKSEHFKAELITNVSHDLKTPLTSIINYVDLLKKEDISNPKAQEYIEVLDRKSQRLKKLTEDLVEASKASTGALTVNKERLNLVQLIEQAVGEYNERLSGAGLTLVTDLPEAPVYVSADGRHLWRVLDNLLSNCAKYALEGTRVYLDVAVREETAVITVKNISRQPLNIPAEQLVERFVRGDESRTTEGSGLGLSIARSLTELQGGRFFLEIDGDLFKAMVVFPLA